MEVFSFSNKHLTLAPQYNLRHCQVPPHILDWMMALLGLGQEEKDLIALQVRTALLEQNWCRVLFVT